MNKKLKLGTFAVGRRKRMARLRVRASERCGIGGGRGRCATRHIRDVIALPPSLPNFPLSVFPLILAPSRLSLLLRHLTASLSLSLFLALSVFPRSLSRSRSAKVDPLEQLDPGKRAMDTAWSNRCCLVANETPQNPCLSRCETDLDLIPRRSNRFHVFDSFLETLRPIAYIRTRSERTRL